MASAVLKVTFSFIPAVIPLSLHVLPFFYLLRARRVLPALVCAIDLLLCCVVLCVACFVLCALRAACCVLR